MEQELPAGGQVHRTGGIPGQHQLWRLGDRRPCLLSGAAGLHRGLRRRLRDRCPRPPGSAGRGSGAVPTIAVMAGGVDRFYPSGNEDLLRAVANQGAVLAEVPPGFGAHPLPVPSAQQAHRGARGRDGGGGGQMAFRSAEYGPPRGNSGPGGRGRARLRAQRELGRLPPAAAGRRRRLRDRRGGDRRAGLAQRRILAARRGRRQRGPRRPDAGGLDPARCAAAAVHQFSGETRASWLASVRSRSARGSAGLACWDLQVRKRRLEAIQKRRLTTDATRRPAARRERSLIACQMLGQ